jgi:hypothetical protein
MFWCAMADWHVVENVGRTLVLLIERRIGELAIGGVTVALTTTAAFPALRSTSVPFVSLFLFQISGNPEMRNRPMQLGPNGQLRRQSLPLELCYFITAWGVRAPNDIASDGVAAREEARLLGAVMQALYDNAEVGRSDLFELVGTTVWAPGDGLQIAMETLPVDQHYRIWDAGEMPYRLSLIYRVRVASLDPSLPPATPSVVQAQFEVVP